MADLQTANANAWLAAAGQIFFTLSIGTGSILTYASYLKQKDDIALTGLTTSITNEFAEVIFGGSLAIPMKMSRKQAAMVLGAVLLLCGLPVVVFFGHGFLDEMNFWSGTFGLVVFALIEVILCA
jgi:SNF family Na+-dependent transporter